MWRTIIWKPLTVRFIYIITVSYTHLDVYKRQVLIGLGMRMLSMGFASVAQTKKMINNITIAQAEEMAKTVQQLSSAEEVEAYLKSALADIL